MPTHEYSRRLLKRNAKDQKDMCYVFQILKGTNFQARLLCPEELKGKIIFMIGTN